jgi:DNA recombination protein RmuC
VINYLLIATLVLLVVAVALLIKILMSVSQGAWTSAFLPRFDNLEKAQDRIERAVREEMALSRDEQSKAAREQRQELTDAFKMFGDSVIQRMTDVAVMQKTQLEAMSSTIEKLSDTNEKKLEAVRVTVEEKLQSIQIDNAKQLDQMRQTVDEKLHGTLEKRLGESFRQVSERLEQVYKGLGEMQLLASGVGDLKKVLTNVKTRGTWGEIQLGALLDQILTPDQYEKNVATKKGSRENVEFAIKLPGREGNPVWLPIDAKFPKEDYEKLLDAQEKGVVDLIDELTKSLENRIKAEAKDIRDKYIDPPNTTDFGILFLPIEGLYAEILRRPGLCEYLQKEYRISVAGPTTIAAFLNSLQMGFRTLAVEKRAGEVWGLLGAVKTEFGKFGDILDKTHKKLQEASNNIEDAARKSRTIERKLRNVEISDESKAVELIGLTEESINTGEM